MAAAPPESLPWRRSLAWLAFLAPLFFLSYGYANRVAEARAVTTSVHFAWERAIPFLPWTIVPYWSIDLLYGLSFLLCRTRRAVDVHGLRLLTAQGISVAGFLAFPLRFDFPRPPADGLPGALFGALASFDKPYNQAPALHIGLLLIIWVRFAEATRGPGRLAVHAWAALIAVSTLTTFQHHFIDLATGAAVGLLCLWLWPDVGPGLVTGWRSTADPTRRRLAGRYAAAAGICALLATPGGTALWLLWPALALTAVALIYLGLGPAGFQKGNGRSSPATTALLAPYRLGAWINSRLWTRGDAKAVRVADGVWLGRLPSRLDASGAGYATLVDLAAELPPPCGPWATISLPWLDLVPPGAAALAEAAAIIEDRRAAGPLLVYCALGYSRSAAAVAAWLLASGRASDPDDAIAQVRRARPQARIGPIQHEALTLLASRATSIPSPHP